MKVLIAILSCHALRDCEQSLRDTWVKEIPEGVDYRFFLGSPQVITAPDEVVLTVGDSFQDITHKAVALYTWALEHDYEYVFKADLDTLIRPVLLLQCGFEQWDYMGGKNHYFASGGAGYWVSKKAMQHIVSRPITTGPEEDLHTAHALLENGIELHADDRFKFCPGDSMDDRTITFHLSSVKAWNEKATPKDLYSVWADQKARKYKIYATFTSPPKRQLRLRRFQ